MNNIYTSNDTTVTQHNRNKYNAVRNRIRTISRVANRSGNSIINFFSGVIETIRHTRERMNLPRRGDELVEQLAEMIQTNPNMSRRNWIMEYGPVDLMEYCLDLYDTRDVDNVEFEML